MLANSFVYGVDRGGSLTSPGLGGWGDVAQDLTYDASGVFLGIAKDRWGGPQPGRYTMQTTPEGQLIDYRLPGNALSAGFTNMPPIGEGLGGMMPFLIIGGIVLLLVMAGRR